MGGVICCGVPVAGSWVRHFSRSLLSLFQTGMSSLSSEEHLTLGAGLSGECVGDLVRLVGSGEAEVIKRATDHSCQIQGNLADIASAIRD